MSYRWTIPQSRRPQVGPCLGAGSPTPKRAGVANSSSIPTMRRPRPATGSAAPRLALRVLRPAPRLAQTDLLALDLTRVAGHEARLAQHLAEVLVVRHQRARDPVTDRAGLACRAAAADRDVHVELAFRFRDRERLTGDHPRRLAAEKCVERPAVDDDVAAAGPYEHPCRRRLAAPRSIVTLSGHRL